MQRLTAPVLAALVAVLAACTESGTAPLSVSVCDLAQYPQRLVQLKAEVRLRNDGQAVISDAGCATERIELRLTGAAVRAGLEAALKTALAAGADKVRVPVSLTGVYAAAPDAFFTAEALVIAPAGR
jgi:hypothetical protein